MAALLVRGASVRRQALRPVARAMSSLASDISSTLTELKEIQANPPAPAYPLAQFKADLAAGKMDQAAFLEMFSYDEGVKKGMLGLIKTNSALKAETPKDIDWDKAASKIVSPGVVDALKKIVADEPATRAPFTAKLDEMIAASAAAVKAAETAAKPELLKLAAERDQELISVISQLELMGTQIDGLRNTTIAEILEQEPALREEIEEEIKNHVWAP